MECYLCLEALKKLRDSKNEEQEPIPDEEYILKCPIYKTANRLSKGLVSGDQVPVEYLRLPTMSRPEKWVKDYRPLKNCCSVHSSISIKL